MRKIGEFLLASHRNAAIVAFVCALLPLIRLPGGFLAAVILAFVTLQKGNRAGLFILLWVALPAVALLFLHRFSGFDVLLLRCLAVWLLACLLRSFASWRLVLEVAAIAAVVIIVLLHALVPDLKSWWNAQLLQYLNELSSAAAWKLSSAEISTIVNRLVPIASGLVGFVVLLGAFVQLLLARWWQSALFSPGSLRLEFMAIRMERNAALILLVAFVGLLLRVGVIADCMPVLLLPFIIAGLSFLHFVVNENKKLIVPLVLIYVGLLLIPIFILGLLVLVGYVDSWCDLRHKLKIANKNV